MPYNFYYLFDFTGGVNTASSIDNLLENELLIAENVELSQRGGFRRRTGISEYANIGSSRIERLIEFEYYDTGTQSRVNKKLALMNGDLIDIDTQTVLTSGLGNHVSFEVFNDKLYILGNGLYKVYDGSTLSDVTNSETDSNLDAIKRCKYLVQRGQRFFVAGDPENPNLLYFSEVGDPTYFKTTSIVKAVTDDGDVITGLKEFHGALLVFKSRAIFAWFGYDPATDVQFQRLNVHTGTKAHRTIQYVGNSLFFLGEDGVYALVGTYKDVISTIKISKNINELVKQINHKEPYEENTPCAVYYDGKYMLSVSTGEDVNVNDTIYVFHKNLFDTNESESWVVYTGWNISDFLLARDGTLYSASSSTGRIHLHEDIYNDLGNGIALKMKLKPLSIKAPVHNKKFRRGYVVMKQHENTNSSVNITCTVDYRENSQTVTPDESLVWDYRNWDEAYWDFTDVVTRKFDIKDKGKRLIIEFYDDTVDQALEIYGIGIEYKIKKPDRR